VTDLPNIPTAKIEVGLTGPTTPSSVWHIGDPVRGMIGVAAIGAADLWVDITYAVRSWSYRRGLNRGNGIGLRYEAGTFTAEINNGDRNFDPTHLTGIYASGGLTTLLPMVRVRLSAVWNGVAYTLLTANADAWVPDYSDPDWSVTTLTATDGFKVLTGRRRTAVTPVGAGEDSGARVGRVLDSLSWPADDRVIAVGKSVVQATDLSGDGLAEIQLTQDSEMGEFYMDAYNQAVYRNRHAVLTETRSNTAQAVFGDAGPAAGEIPYTATAVGNDDVTMANRVVAQNVGGIEQVAEDAASQARYLVKEYPKTDLILTTDAEALNWAEFVLGESKDPELRFERLDFNVARPDAAETAWPALLGRELGDRVTVIRRPPGGGDPNERDCWVRGIEMNSNGEDWKVSMPLETTTRTNYWTIGHPTLGQIGTVNALAF
jgi:hypothetical protein